MKLKPASPVVVHRSLRFFKVLLLVWSAAFSLTCAAQERELVRDPHFQDGFYLSNPNRANASFTAKSKAWPRRNRVQLVFTQAGT